MANVRQSVSTNASSDDLTINACSSAISTLGNLCQNLQDFACHISRCLWSPCRIGQRCHAEGALKNRSKSYSYIVHLSRRRRRQQLSLHPGSRWMHPSDGDGDGDEATATRSGHVVVQFDRVSRVRRDGHMASLRSEGEGAGKRRSVAGWASTAVRASGGQ